METVSRATGRSGGIQLLRGILCLGIVVAHSFAYYEIEYDMVVGETLSFWGRYALLCFVNIFFAITGFFMAGAVYKADYRSSGLVFLKRRFLRIYPTYWAAVAAIVLLRLCFNGVYTANKRFWQVFFLVSSDAPYPAGVEWTLLYDVAFYLVVAFFISGRRKRFFPVFLAVWAVSIWIGTERFAIPHGGVMKFPERLFCFANLAFVSGSIAQYIYIYIVQHAQDKTRNLALVVRVLGSPLCQLLPILAFVANYETLYVYSWGRVLHELILIWIVLSSVFGRGWNRLLCWLGNCSYEIYLIHPTILSLSFQMIRSFGISRYHPLLLILAVCTSLLAGVGFSHAAGKIERLWTCETRERFDWKRLIRLAVVVIAVLLSYTAVWTAKTVKQRFSQRPISFSEELVVEDGLAYEGGWVDQWDVTRRADGRLDVIAEGWAFDPIHSALVENVVVVLDGEVCPGSIKWYDRIGIAEAIGNPAATTCGYVLRVTGIDSAQMPGEVGIYAVLEDGRFLELHTSDGLRLE